MTFAFDQITASYRQRWNVAPYHKSLKQNASLEKSPGRPLGPDGDFPIQSSLCRFMRLHQARMVAEIDQTQSLRA